LTEDQTHFDGTYQPISVRTYAFEGNSVIIFKMHNFFTDEKRLSVSDDEHVQLKDR